jgi:hypothetical protein
MTVTADSYEAKAIENAISMLAASATFRTLVGASTSDEAKAFIIETYGGNPGQNSGRQGKALSTTGATIDLATQPHAVIGLGLEPGGGVATQAGGVGSFDYDFAIGVRLTMPRAMQDNSPAEASRLAWNRTGLIRQEMQAQVGGANALADCEIESAGLFLDEEGVNRPNVITQLIITARG